MKKRKLIISLLAGIMAVVLIFSLVAGILPYFFTNAATSSSKLKQQLAELQEDKKKIDKEIKALEKDVAGNLTEMEVIVDKKNAIDQQIFMIYEKVNNLNEQITIYSNMIADKQEELDIAEARLAELNEKNKERIRAMEEQGSLSYWSVLFKANSFSDLLDRFNMIEEIAAADRRRLDEMSDVAEQIAETKASLEQEKVGLEESKKQLEVSQQELEVKRAEADKLLEQLLAKGDEYEKLLAKAEDEAAEIAADIKDKKQEISDAQKAEESSKPSGGSKPSGSAPSNDNDYVPSSAKWLVPCKYTRFSSPFGYRIHPVYKDWRKHNGVDLGAPKGTPIIASRGGKITIATWNNSAGYYVKIDHGDGFASVYMHMTHYIVKKGDTVKAGQTIGYVGSTGTSTGNHLHFGIMYKGTYVNPAKYIKIK